MQCVAQLRSEALLGEHTVAELGTLVIGDDAHDRPELGEHASPLRVGERRRGLDVEDQLGARRRLVRMLAARTTR